MDSKSTSEALVNFKKMRKIAKIVSQLRKLQIRKAPDVEKIPELINYLTAPPYLDEEEVIRRSSKLEAITNGGFEKTSFLFPSSSQFEIK